MKKNIQKNHNIPDENHKNSKVDRFEKIQQPQDTNKRTWPSEGVVYVGHLPHGFLEEQLTSYFSQYGDVLGVKVARSKITARSKGYAFIQFRYAEIANIVSDTMNGYLLLGKILVSHTLPPNSKNPFAFSSSHQYKFINWKKMFVQKKNKPKIQEQAAWSVHKLLRLEGKRREKFRQLGIQYQFPGFKQHIPVEKVEERTQSISKSKNKSK